MKQFISSIRAIESVIDYFTWRNACSSGASRNATSIDSMASRKVCVPFNAP